MAQRRSLRGREVGAILVVGILLKCVSAQHSSPTVLQKSTVTSGASEPSWEAYDRKEIKHAKDGSATETSKLAKRSWLKKLLPKQGVSKMPVLNEGGDSNAEVNWLFDKDKEGLPVLAIIFLVFGFVCMTVGAIFSLVMAVQYDGDADIRPMGPVYYYIIFFVCSVSALVYFSMWSETGVAHITEYGKNGEAYTRVVFPARYLDWAVTSPLILVGLGLLGNSSLPALLGMVGSDLIMIGCLYTAALYAPVHKYFWFGVAVVFFLVLVFLMLQELSKADQGGRVSEYDADTLRWLTYSLLLCWAVFHAMWLVGMVGASEASLNVEVAGTVLADMTAKVANPSRHSHQSFLT